MTEKQKPWYKKWWGILIIVFIWPFFLLWYAWAKSNWKQNTKLWITGGVSAFLLLAMATSGNGGTEIQTSTKPASVKPPITTSIDETSQSPSPTPSKSIEVKAPSPTSTPQPQTAAASAPTAPASSGGVVKMSSTNICHAPGTTYYEKTKNYTPYNSLEACIAAGGRLPKR